MYKTEGRKRECSDKGKNGKRTQRQNSKMAVLDGRLMNETKGKKKRRYSGKGKNGERWREDNTKEGG